MKRERIENKPEVDKQVRPYRVIEAKPYNPEAGLECIISAEEFHKRMRIPLEVEVVESGPDGKERKVKRETEIFGTVCLVEVDRNGVVSATRHRIKDNAAARELKESELFKKTKLIEQFGYDPFSLGVDLPSSSMPPNDEFHPLLSGPYFKQLYLFDYLDMHSKAFEAKNHNPLAKDIVDIITNYAVGKGVKVMFKNPSCQNYWDRFEKRVGFQSFLRRDCDTLTWAGEIMTHKTKTGDGEPTLKTIDPSTVWEIVTEPSDITLIFYYHQQFPTQYQLVYKAGDIVSRYIVNDIPANEVIHVKINTAPGEKRGRSDLFPVLGWLKRFKDYYNAKVIKAQVEESFAIRKTIKGADTDVNQFASDPTLNMIPPPGSIIFENESMTTDFLQATASAGATDNTGEAIRSIVATGVGLSPEMLGVGGAASTRATALTKAEPSTKKFEMRQITLEDYIRDISEWVVGIGIERGEIHEMEIQDMSFSSLKAALLARDWNRLLRLVSSVITGKLVMDPINKSFEVIFPELLTDDRSAKLKDIAFAQTARAISHERMSNMMAKELSVTSYDYDEEKATIRDEMQDDVVNPYAGVMSPSAGAKDKTMPPAPGSDNGKPGSSSDKAKYKDDAKGKS